MQRLWLLFAQTVTVLVAVYFVIATLQPQWLKSGASPLGSPAGITVLQDASPPSAAQLAPSSSFSAAVQRAAPSVVSINTSTSRRNPNAQDPWFLFFHGQQDSRQTQSGLGSGVIVSADGFILTNHHVIAGAGDIEVVLSDTRTTRAKVVGIDPETDLAVLKIDLLNLPVMTFSDSEQAQVGDLVLAIGNPFGVGQTVTSGIVSALGRNQLGINTFEDFIQTDAAINPGNSGGALVNAQGALLGINTAIYSQSGGSMGIGFAIPTSTARMVLDAIVRNGSVTRGWIGIEPSDLTPELAQRLGLELNGGVLVSGVLQSGPAAQSGLRPGDVIVQIQGQAIGNTPELLKQVSQLPPGQPAAFGLIREGQTHTVNISPSTRPSQRQLQRR